MHLARILAKGLGAQKEDILPLETADPEKLESNKHLVLLYPVHGFNAPRPVKRFVRALPAGLFEAVSLIAVGFAGNWLNGAVSSDLRRPLEKKGYPLVVDEDLAMPLTFIMSFPDDLNMKLIAESERKITDLCTRILNTEVTDKEVLLKSKMVNFLGIPKEGFGFSNDAIGKFGPKDFSEWLFDISGDTRIQITASYMF